MAKGRHSSSRERPALSDQSANPGAMPRDSATAESSSKRHGWKWLLTGPRLVVSTILVAVIGFVVPVFGPSLLDRFTVGSRITATAFVETLSGGSFAYAFPRSVAGLSLPSLTNLATNQSNWAVSHGGVHAGQTDVKLTIEGRRFAEVSIVEIRAHVLERRSPLQGALLFVGSQGDVPNINIALNLDAAVPIARIVDEPGSLGSAFFVSHTINLVRGERATFQITAFTATCFCKWELLLDLLVNGKREIISVQAEGNQPFTTTAWSHTYASAIVRSSVAPDGLTSVGPDQACVVVNCSYYIQHPWR